MSRGLVLAALSAALVGCPSDDGPLDDDDATTPEPTPDPGPDCTDRVGLDAECAAVSCAALLAEEPDLADGDYFIDGGTTEPGFVVLCDMESDDPGWIRLSLDDDDGAIVASRTLNNPWSKCADDAAFHYAQIGSEDDVVEDLPEGSRVHEVEVRWRHPESGEVYTPGQAEVLRDLVSELHPGVRMVATSGDDDGSNWREGGGSGLEVYAVGRDGAWFPLTPGAAEEDCGGGEEEWPEPGSETGFYLWSTNADFSRALGDVGMEQSGLGALPPEVVLPAFVELAVFTGGGVSFGFNTDVIRVR